MQFQYINETIELLEKFLAEYGGEPVPCTIEEVKQLESMLPSSYQLPIAYKEFLLYAGKACNQFYEEGSRFDYGMALVYVNNERHKANQMMKYWDPSGKELPEDVYILTTYMDSYYDFFKLTEGNNPPVYVWSEEEELGIEGIEKKHNSFTEFIREEIRIRHLLLVFGKTKKKIKDCKPPRGLQFWLPEYSEYKEGVSLKKMRDYFGFIFYEDIEHIATTFGLDSYSYLEELSGWKRRTIGEEIRFFPPSDEPNG